MSDFDQAVTELERAVGVALDVIARGERGFYGLSDDPEAPREFLCAGCVEALPPD